MPNEPLPDDIRNVWQNQPVENAPMPLEEIQRRARRFEKRIDRRNLREYAAAAFGIAAYTFYIFIFHSLVVRAGSVMVIAGVLYIVVQLYRRASSGSLPEDLGVTASIEFHRRELVRQRDMLGMVSTSYGFAYGGAAVFSAHIYGRTYLSLNLDGGGEVFRLDGQRVHRATGSALMGGVVAF